MSLTEVLLNVEVETVDDSRSVLIQIERTGAVPRLILRTESLVQEVGERDTVVIGGHLIVGIDLIEHTANGEHNLDTLLLTVGDVLLQGPALAEEVGLNTILVLVSVGPAVRSEVGTRVPRLLLLRSSVDESNRDILDTSVTVVGQTVLSRSNLAL